MKQNVPEERNGEFARAMREHLQSRPETERGILPSLSGGLGTTLATAMTRGRESGKENVSALVIKAIQGVDEESRDRRIKNASRMVSAYDPVKAKDREGAVFSALSWVEDKILIPFHEMVPAMAAGARIHRPAASPCRARNSMGREAGRKAIAGAAMV